MRLAHAAALAGAVVFSLAHVGSPDTIFEGQAGPYAVRVVVRTPGVVPGLADIAVRITDGPAGSRVVTVIPLRGGLPTAQEPPPDTARVVAGDSSLYSAQLWLMRFGAYSVRVMVAGAGGSGSAIVPVNAVAVGRLDMKRPVAIALIALGLFLFAGAVTIVYAAVKEGVLPPGEVPDARRRRRAAIVASLAVLGFVAYLVFGNWWWEQEDKGFRRGIYRAPEVVSAAADRGNRRVFRLTIADSATFRRSMSPLIPDHGKLMHLFLVGASDQAVAHLHPRPVDSTTFETTLPPLPAGTYYVFADIVHETGFSQTLTDTLSLPAAAQPAWTPSDPDDAWLAGESGTTIAWSRPAELRSGTDVNLTFAAPGAPIEPYMGMAGHAIVARSDGRVFVHLHPNGTIPRAAQLVYELREPGDTVRGRLGTRITERELRRGEGSKGGVEEVRQGTSHAHSIEPESVTFPYSFPEPGRYRIWVQIKSRGRIVTGAFEADVS